MEPVMSRSALACFHNPKLQAKALRLNELIP